MRAFYVHGSDGDWVVIPDTEKAVQVTARLMARFLSPDPWFESWGGKEIEGPPETYGTVAATRNDEAPVVAVDAALWEERKKHWQSQPMEEEEVQAAQEVEDEDWSLDDMDFD